MRILNLIDRLSMVMAFLTMAMFLVLVGDMLYEVVSRRVFDRPTLWAYDIAYMTNGAIYLLASAYALLDNEHIRIDFLSQRLPRAVQDWINVAVYVCLVIPALLFILAASADAAWTALITGELEPSSPWKPLIWPFYTAILVGVALLILQTGAQCVRHALSALGRGPSPLDRRAEEL